MLCGWFTDIESLEAIRSDRKALALVLHLAALSKRGTLEPFVAGLDATYDLDEECRRAISEFVEDESFLLAVEDYVRRTSVLH
jgi:hypothetical protein